MYQYVDTNPLATTLNCTRFYSFFFIFKYFWYIHVYRFLQLAIQRYSFDIDLVDFIIPFVTSTINTTIYVIMTISGSQHHKFMSNP